LQKKCWPDPVANLLVPTAKCVELKQNNRNSTVKHLKIRIFIKNANRKCNILGATSTIKSWIVAATWHRLTCSHHSPAVVARDLTAAQQALPQVSRSGGSGLTSCGGTYIIEAAWGCWHFIRFMKTTGLTYTPTQRTLGCVHIASAADLLIVYMVNT
jgi:hypothetical protein